MKTNLVQNVSLKSLEQCVIEIRDSWNTPHIFLTDTILYDNITFPNWVYTFSLSLWIVPFRASSGVFQSCIFPHSKTGKLVWSFMAVGCFRLTPANTNQRVSRIRENGNESFTIFLLFYKQTGSR